MSKVDAERRDGLVGGPGDGGHQHAQHFARQYPPGDRLQAAGVAGDEWIADAHRVDDRQQFAQHTIRDVRADEADDHDGAQRGAQLPRALAFRHAEGLEQQGRVKEGGDQQRADGEGVQGVEDDQSADHRAGQGEGVRRVCHGVCRLLVIVLRYILYRQTICKPCRGV
jgi:hypothetical protein